jgi:hypothetical protein
MNTEENTSTAVAAENAAEETENKLDYSLDNLGETEEDSQESAESKKKEPEEEYALDLGDLDEDDRAYADIMTAAAKNAGLDSKAASACFKEFTKALHDKHEQELQAQHAALVKEWGKNFKTKSEATRRFMATMFKNAGFSDEEMQQFANPASVRLFSKLKDSMQGSKFAGSAAPSAPRDPKEELNDMMKEWAKVRFSNDASLEDLTKIRTRVNNLSMKVHGVTVV